MIPAMRQWFNTAFTIDKYNDYLAQLDNKHPDAISFRVAETPIFIDKSFTNKILEACESIVDVIVQPNFYALTKNAVPPQVKVPNGTKFSNFIAFDFGICENEQGELEPQLVEMQGFPSLFAFQILQEEIATKCWQIPDTFSTYFNNFDSASYINLLKEIILGNYAAENVVLLEIFPHAQKTKIDFYCTEDYVGIKTICLTELIQENKLLYYIHNGVKTPIKRIYNRIIFDDLQQQTQAIQEKGKLLLQDLDVEWVPHPNWFYKISKYTLPFIKHKYVPETRFLDEIDSMPTDLENYVLKPLFSFAGQGVIIDVTPADIAAVEEPHNWILQKKVKYADVIVTPNEPAKAEIRIFYFWKDGEPRPIATNNLARLSKGKMIGVRYNANKDWVGGTLAYFEK